ncbi:sugar ABC transporter substrate-binding protein [Cnuibacter physcomitrellae]|uniref:sugar ABC transporter substrate-binding protein n=1 Tax=Cnuibacter physcomitrellae TaxID=1619308 RepID=UPI002175CA87|nr:sugar ABC transporter substrate-binding protein [Cnuibacter physcomitrellae]MCS5497837.1 sugar ABC transporter substrate-binding protein [Cnuibacter physcomitrellae]
MKGRVWSVGIAGLAVISLFGLAGCSSGGGGTGSGNSSEVPDSVNLNGETVVSLFTSMNNDYYASWAQGAQRAVEAFNGKYVGLTNEGDPATELAQFQQQVDAGVKIIFITAPDPSNVPAMAQIAEQNDVCFVNTWEQPTWTSPFDSGDQYVSYLTPDSEEVAYTVAKALFDEIGGKGNVVHLTGHPGATPDQLRNAGFDRALKEYPDIKVIAEQPGEWNRDDARQAMAGIITQVGVDQINAVFGQNDDVGIGALNALTEAGVSTEDLPPITGIDGNLSTMQLIKAGQMFGSYSGIPQYQAGFSFVQALDYCKGGKVDPLNRMLNTGGIFVTADNVDDYINTYTGDNDPYDWVKMSRVAFPDDWDPQNEVSTIDMEKMWSLLEPKPASFQLPQAYADAVPTRADVDKEWADHWKLLKD